MYRSPTRIFLSSLSVIIIYRSITIKRRKNSFFFFSRNENQHRRTETIKGRAYGLRRGGGEATDNLCARNAQISSMHEEHYVIGQAAGTPGRLKQLDCPLMPIAIGKEEIKTKMFSLPLSCGIIQDQIQRVPDKLHTEF